MGNRINAFMRIQWAFMCLTFLFSSLVFAQNVNFRVMSYNGLKLDGSDTDRQDDFQTVLDAADPDILLMQEIVDAAGADLILDALNVGGVEYARATFNNGTDTDNMLFYRTSVASLSSQQEISTALREISEYVLQIGDNEIRFYSCHLKASSGTTNENKRALEVGILRDHLNALPSGTEFIIVGDMNIYDDDEPAYLKFIADEADNDGRAEDPLAGVGGVGNWHNNATYAAYHTQSPRTTQFGGGAHGGMDDRFDFILTSFGINDTAGVDLVANSYTAFGNDGNHFNQAINSGTNTAVSQAVADALHAASDHLPIYADFTSIATGGGGSSDVLFSEIFYDTPGTDSQEEWIELYNTSASTVDISGWTIKDNNGSGSTFTFPTSTTIAATSYLTVAANSTGFNALYSFDADLYGNIPSLNNSGDALILSDDSTQEVDAVAWEGGASQGTPSGWGSSSEPSVSTGNSIQRSTSSTDTDTHSDWIDISSNGDPGVQSTTPPASGDLVISEVFYDTPGTDSQEEWIEIFNGSSSSIELDSYTITDNNGSGSTYTFPANTDIPASTFITIATNSSGFSSLYGFSADLSGSVPALNNSGDALVFKDDSGTTIDEVAWEGGASQGTPSGWGSSSLPQVATGVSIIRTDVFVDTDTHNDWGSETGNGDPNTQADGVYTPKMLSSTEEALSAPDQITLGNYPNPFNPSTKIHYSLVSDGLVQLTVYNMLGQQVAQLVNDFRASGSYEVNFDASNLSSGVYIYRLKTGSQILTQKMLLAK